MSDSPDSQAPTGSSTVGAPTSVHAPGVAAKTGKSKWYFLGAALLLIIGIVFVVAQFGSSGPSIANSYVGRGPTVAVLIQWQQNGSQLTGTIQVDSVTGSAPNESLGTNTANVSGLISGNHVNISANGSSTEGTINGPNITIDSANSNGTVSAGTLSPGSFAEFNKAVASLNSSISSANQAAVQQQATQADQSTITQDANSVISDLSQLSQDQGTLSTSVQALPALVTQAQIDTATTTSSAKTAEKLGPSDNCVTADATSNDADTVQSDIDSVQSGVDSVTSAIDSVRNDVQSLQADAAKLQSAQAALPSYPSNAPSNSSIERAIATSNQAISTAVSQTNGYIDQANATLAIATQAANAADLAGSCGGYPAGATIQHIS